VAGDRVARAILHSLPRAIMMIRTGCVAFVRRVGRIGRVVGPGQEGRATRADDGSAMIEFVGLSVVLLIPFVYLFLCVFAVQRAAFGVTQAAREAGRAFATADSETQGMDRARLAAQLALADQGVPGAPQVRFAPEGADCGAGDPGDGAATLEPGASFVVCVRTVVALPGTGALFSGITDVTVNGQFTVVIDQFRADRRETQP
jgi:hypothetical protein